MDPMGPTGGVMPEDMGGPLGYRTLHMPLAIDRVRFVGERVAAVIAESEAQARDAADLIAIDYDVLPAVVMAEDAVKEDAPLVYEKATNNTSFTLRLGNGDETEAAISRAHHVTKLHLHNNRLPEDCGPRVEQHERQYDVRPHLRVGRLLNHRHERAVQGPGDVQ